MDPRSEREFDALVRAHGSSFMRLAVGLTGERAAAEDLLQTALTKTFLAWGRVHSADDAVAYVRRIIVNTHTSSHRRRRVREYLTPAVHEPQAVVAPAAGSDDVLLAALGRLGRRQRAVVLLRYQQDWSDEDIATALGCSTATVRSQASRALATLRDLPELAVRRPHAATAREGP